MPSKNKYITLLDLSLETNVLQYNFNKDLLKEELSYLKGRYEFVHRTNGKEFKSISNYFSNNRKKEKEDEYSVTLLEKYPFFNLIKINQISLPLYFLLKKGNYL